MMIPGRAILLWLSVSALLLGGCKRRDVVDEAMAAGKRAADFPETRADVFRGMDGGIQLTPGEVAGRNTWMLWTGGNEAFWDYLAQHGYGLIDFLKVIDSRQRPHRFASFGLINEPGYHEATKPDKFGLYIDQPVSPDPDGTNPAVDGVSTGIVGFRLFPNPNFDEAARKKWDPQRYYTDEKYYQNPKLVRPYRVGMTCALCHVAPHPLHPPADPEAPAWENLSATIGNQYFRTRGVFGGSLKPNDFLYHVLESANPGTVETSIIATDNNNNPNIINSIYNVPARLAIATEERVTDGSVLMPPGTPQRRVPHILVDGADSIGVAGALDRVFVNIGMFGEYWMKCQNPIIGVRKQTPFSIAYARKHSIYWQVTEERTSNLAAYLIKASGPMPLRDAPGGQKYLTTDETVLNRGRSVFAQKCMPCHSSKRPNDQIFSHPVEYANWAENEVMKPDFLENNFLSNDTRYPITVLQTNASRALQDNATRGKIWEEFSSENYKETPSIGEITIYNPFTKQDYRYRVRSGGPGFYRVPTLVAIWAAAPFLHNNSLGDYNGDPSVDGRMRAFDDAIDKMFYPEKRHGVDSIARVKERCWFVIGAPYLPGAAQGVIGPMARPLTDWPWLFPALIIGLGLVFILAGRRRRKKVGRIILILLGAFFLLIGLIAVPLSYFAAGKLGDLRIGPLPKGMPINALASMNPNAPPLDALAAIWKMEKACHRIEKEHLSDEEAERVFEKEAGPALLKVSKSPDWVQDRGHYFPVTLSDEDKAALKEYLKTF